jgi:hypothetical protein
VPDVEGNFWDDLVKKRIVPNNHVALIQTLQFTHDNWEIEDWREGLLAAAQQYNLSPAVLEE